MFRKLYHKNPFLSFVAVIMLCASCIEQQKPNILLIVADDLGYSDLGCYGGEIETPSLNELARNGIRLTSFYSTGRCCPSRATILTGLYPHRSGLGHMVQDLGLPGYRGRVNEDAIVVAELLRYSGYRSFISGKWHLGTPDPTQYGFEEFYGTLVSAQTFWDPEHYLRLPEGRKARTYTKEIFYGTNALTDHALDFLTMARETPEQPWFLYLAYNAPHFPLQAPRDVIEKYAKLYEKGWDRIRKERLLNMKEMGILPDRTELSPRSRYWDWAEAEPEVNPAWDEIPEERKKDLVRRMAVYAAMVDVLDQNIGRIVRDLRSHHELENTLIVFISDNGACAEWDPHGFDVNTSPNNILHQGSQIGEMGGPGTYHSVGSGWANASNTPWRLYKHYNHEGGISSPCIVHWPDKIDRMGAIDRRPGHLIDLVPTLLQVAEIGYPPQWKGRETVPLPGTSMIPLLLGDSTGSRTLFFEHEGNRAIIDGNWKLSALGGGDWELYNMETDRTELKNLADQHPEIVTELDHKWQAWAEENNVLPMPEDFQVPYLPSSNN